MSPANVEEVVADTEEGNRLEGDDRAEVRSKLKVGVLDLVSPTRRGQETFHSLFLITSPGGKEEE